MDYQKKRKSDFEESAQDVRIDYIIKAIDEIKESVKPMAGICTTIALHDQKLIDIGKSIDKLEKAPENKRNAWVGWAALGTSITAMITFFITLFSNNPHKGQ